MKILSFIFVIAISIQYAMCDTEETKTKCQGCKDLVDGILKGLDKTKNKNFEGGDVDWEERKLGSYKTSETRFIEIIESACSKTNHRCNSILEEKEDDIKHWYEKLQDEISLHNHLCVEKAKVCCPDNTFGSDCKECPKGSSNKICFGRGECEGAGDREGSGKCVCDEGYTGEYCDECAENHFETYKNDTYLMCSLCHQSCKTCKGNKSTDCLTCMPGYRDEENIENEDEKKCVDINECVEQPDLCPVGTYCANNEGSYSCEDIDECASGAICLGMYEVCVNTIGHYKCECARYFRRDKVTGQCQPDPNIYSRLAPPKPAASEEAKAKKSEEEQTTGGEDVDHQVEDSLSEDDIKRIIVAVLICIIGTAAANGNMLWTALFFMSIAAAGVWWASDKTDRIVESLARSHHQEL